MLQAKPVIANRYWILRQDDRKVGCVERDKTGFSVKINGRHSHFNNMPLLRRKAMIQFHPMIKTAKPPQNLVHGYDTGCRAYNGMWDVKKRLPLFTKTARSKSWYAAGWFAVLQHNRWQLVQNPKLILLERYQFRGPYMREDQVRMDP